MRRPVAMLAAIWLLAAGGCASRGNGQIAVLTQERVDAALVRGVTSRDDVRRAWGDALVTQFPEGAEVWFYTYSKSASQLVKYVPLVGRMAATGTSVKELKILFDANGHVKKYVLQDIHLQ